MHPRFDNLAIMVMFLVALIAASTAVLSSIEEAEAQQIELQMPFPAGETWNMGPEGVSYNGNRLHGGGYDLVPPSSSTGRVVAVADGRARAVCSFPGGQVIVRLQTAVGEFQYGHLAADVSPIPTDRWINVKRGQTVGHLWTNPERIAYGWEVQDNCYSGQTLLRHLHLNVPTAGIVLDGQVLGWCSTNACPFHSNGSASPTLNLGQSRLNYYPPVLPTTTTTTPVAAQPPTPETVETVLEWWARLFPTS